MPSERVAIFHWHTLSHGQRKAFWALLMWSSVTYTAVQTQAVLRKLKLITQLRQGKSGSKASRLSTQETETHKENW